MKKRTLLVSIVAAATVFFTVLGLSLVGIRRAMDEAVRRSTEDAVQVIAGGVAELYVGGRSPTAAEVSETIKSLIHAGVIHGGFDRNQKATDAYDTPFRVTHYTAGKKHVVTATSAGPDRVFGTPDDIARSAETEAPDPGKK